MAIAGLQCVCISAAFFSLFHARHRCKGLLMFVRIARFFAFLPADGLRHKLARGVESRAMYRFALLRWIHVRACPAPLAGRPRTAAHAMQRNAAAYADEHSTESRALWHALSGGFAPAEVKCGCRVRSGTGRICSRADLRAPACRVS